MTVANKPGHRGEHEVSRKTIACGNAGRFRCTRCYSCAFYQYKVHTRPRVQRAPGIPHALLGGERFINDSGALRRGVVKSCVEFGAGMRMRAPDAAQRAALAAWCAADPGPTTASSRWVPALRCIVKN